MLDNQLTLDNDIHIRGSFTARCGCGGVDRKDSKTGPHMTAWVRCQ